MKGTFSANENNIIGGNSPFTFSWNTVPVQNTLNLTELNPGIYTLMITDINGCTATQDITIGEATNCPVNIIDPEMFFADCEIWIKCDFFQSFVLPNQTFFQLDIYPIEGGPNASPVWSPSSVNCGDSFADAFSASQGTASHFTPNLFLNDEDLINVNDLDLSTNCVDALNLIQVLNLDRFPEFDPNPDFFLKGGGYNFKFLVRDDQVGTWLEKNFCLTIPNTQDCGEYRPGPGSAIGKNNNENLINTLSDNFDGNIYTKSDIAVEIFPNPAGNFFILHLKGFEHRINVFVYDIRGSVIKELENFEVLSGTGSIEFDTSDFSSGMYYVKIASQQGVYVTRILIQK